MKKLLPVIAAVLFTAPLQAQNTGPVAASQGFSGFYTRLDVGYNFNHAGNLYYANGIGSNAVSGTGSVNYISGLNTIDFNKASYGAGFNASLGIGYMFNPHIGVDLGIKAGISPKKYTYELTETNPTGNVISTVTSYTKMPLYIIPSIVLSTGADQPFNVYSRLGVAVPLGGRFVEEYEFFDEISDDEYYEEEEFDYYMSKGLYGALGGRIQVNPNFGVYCEVSGMSHTRYLRSSEVIAATENGVSVLEGWNVSQREAEYSSGYTYDPATQTATMPSKGNIISLPSSNFGVSLGAQYHFGGSALNTTAKPGTGGIYVRAGLGYSLPHAGNYYVADGFASRAISGMESYNGTSGTTIVDYEKASYGAGLTASVAGGYMFNQYLGAELGVNLGISPKKYTMEYTDVTTAGNFNYTYETRAKLPVYINPSIVLSTGYDKPFQVYSRLGIALPLGGKFTVTGEEINTTTGDVIDFEEEYKFYMSKALTGALGARYSIADNIGLWAEVGGSSLTRYAKSSEYTSFSINGIDAVGLMPVQVRMTEYSTDFSYDPSTASPSSPSQRPSVSMPYGNVGLSLGVDFRF
jgi:hypothetical protein